MNEKLEELIIKGGALDSLKNSADRLGFKDTKSLVNFLIAVISKSATRRIRVYNQNGEEIIFAPIDEMLLK